MTEEQVVSWRAIVAHCPVIASDGREVGKVLDVAALPQQDIFHGVVFHHHISDRPHIALASTIDRITDHAVYLNVDSGMANSFEEFHQQHVERLGLQGHFFWKHLGWRDSKE